MIQPLKLPDQVYQQLLGEILAGQLSSGTMLSEVDLAARLGVSRTPIREAISRLAAHGLVEVRANRRALVRRLGAERLGHVYQIREALEGMAAELASTSFTAADFARLDVLVAAVGDPIDPGSHSACSQFDLELHRLIAERSGNPLLAREIAKLHDLVQLVRAAVAEIPGAIALAFRQHRQIVKCLRRRDPALARQAMIEHIRSSCAIAVRAVDREPVLSTSSS